MKQNIVWTLVIKTQHLFRQNTSRNFDASSLQNELAVAAPCISSAVYYFIRVSLGEVEYMFLSRRRMNLHNDITNTKRTKVHVVPVAIFWNDPRSRTFTSKQGIKCVIDVIQISNVLILISTNFKTTEQQAD